MNVSAFYSEAAGYHARHFGLTGAAVQWIIEDRARKLSPWITPGARVLEFGCGPGWNLAALDGRERLGYDIARHLAPELAARGIEFVADLAALPAGSFDCILAHHSLEHVPHPAEALLEFHRLLRPGGVLLIYVPLETERRYRRYRADEPHRHLYSWNVQTLARLVAVNGFAVLDARCQVTGYDRFAAKWAARIGSSPMVFHLLRASLRSLARPREVFVRAERPCINQPEKDGPCESSA